MMRIAMILTVMVMMTMVRGQRLRREVVRSHDGLFYHQGPYLSHNHRQVTRQAPASFHRSPLLKPLPHHSTPVRFPATGGETQAINFLPQRQGFIGPALPPQPRHQSLLSPVVSPPSPAPALTFQDNTLRQQPQEIGHQPQEIGHQPQQFGHKSQQLRHQVQEFRHQSQQLSSPQQLALTSSAPHILPLTNDHKPSSALEKLMAIAGEDWDLTTGGSPDLGPEVFQCPALEGHFRSPRDCGVYYQCAQGQAHQRSCDTGLAYNDLTNQCDWAKNVQ